MSHDSTTGPVVTEALDEVFCFVLSKRGILPKGEVEALVARPRLTHLLSTRRISPEQADGILREVGRQVLYCAGCRAIYHGVRAVDGKMYQCRKCASAIPYPQELTQEARMMSFHPRRESTERLAKKPVVAAAPPPPVPTPEETKTTSQDRSARWFFIQNNEKTGPHTYREMGRKIEAGEIDHQTFVWRKGLKTWAPAGQVPDLSDLLAEVPPPLPISRSVSPRVHGTAAAAESVAVQEAPTPSSPTRGETTRKKLMDMFSKLPLVSRMSSKSPENE